MLLAASDRAARGGSVMLAMAVLNADATIAFTQDGARLLPEGMTLATAWPRAIGLVLDRAPQRLDILPSYLNWLLSQGRRDDLRSMLARAGRIDPRHPLVLWFSGAAMLDAADPAARRHGLDLMRQALAADVERYMPVDGAIKAELLRMPQSP
jgi:hypothetical protein